MKETFEFEQYLQEAFMNQIKKIIGMEIERNLSVTMIMPTVKSTDVTVFVDMRTGYPEQVLLANTGFVLTYEDILNYGKMSDKTTDAVREMMGQLLKKVVFCDKTENYEVHKKVLKAVKKKFPDVKAVAE